MKYAEKYGVSRASRKYNKGRSYIYFWQGRWDGSVESLAVKSRRPNHHPNEHTPEEIEIIKRYRRRNPELGVTELWHRLKRKGYKRRVESLYRVMKRLGMLPKKEKKPKRVSKPYEQMTYPGERIQVDVKVVPRCCLADPTQKLYQYTAIDEFSRLRFLYGYKEQSTYSSADFAKRLVVWYKRRGITVECIQTDNGFEFTNRFSPSKKDKKTLFECTLEQLGIKHKLIRPYTPRHNGKVERSHREDHNKFYSCHSFYSCDDLNAQLSVRLNRTNNLPMRPLNWFSPIEFLNNYFVQND
jgi:transposase InsO family protein